MANGKGDTPRSDVRPPNNNSGDTIGDKEAAPSALPESAPGGAAPLVWRAVRRIGNTGAAEYAELPMVPAPPQGEGAPLRLLRIGSPASVERPNVAMKVLHDPVARINFSRPYSGQRRSWNR
jgi:hypothetical protein